MRSTGSLRQIVARFLTRYGMLAVLLLLGLYFTLATYHVEPLVGREGAEPLADSLIRSTPRSARIAIVSQTDATDSDFSATLRSRLADAGYREVSIVQGDPPTVRAGLVALARSAGSVDMIATTPSCQGWTVFESLQREVPAYAHTRLLIPSSQARSTFLSPSNLRNVADQIAVIAVIAVGMTLVILTGGIDLSVGSLVALSAVATAWLIRAWGGTGASVPAMLGASLAAIALCGGMGLFSGLMITSFRIPPFIATLAVMQVASGLAFIVSQGQSIHAVPVAFTWLGRGEGPLTLPNAVVLMFALYGLAHLMMTRCAIGRRIYAVGGNAEAARLSGVRPGRSMLFVYLVSGLAAGMGGVITASQLQAGAPTYGQSYELYVIAAVVVGGTSLSGGQGRIFDTLIGALIIAVIRNGMNLTSIEPYTQKVVLGLVILGAVLADRLRRGTAS
jgi:ribose transport system permease protein